MKIADKQFYQLVASLASNDTISSLPPLVTSDGRLIVESKKKADLPAEMVFANAKLDNTDTIRNFFG